MAGKQKQKTRCVHVNTCKGYDILIREGILSYAGEEIAKVCPQAVKAAVVCDGNAFVPMESRWKAICGTQVCPARSTS